MLGRLLELFKFRWHGFEYNFHWEDYSFLFRGSVARAAATVPIVGYLIIFNDGLSQYLTFEKLAPKAHSYEFISNIVRLRLVYFGLVLLGIAETVYLIKRPYVIKLGQDFFSYKLRILELASPSYFIEANYKIRNSDTDPYTQGGKYYDRDYEDFIEMALGARPGNSIKDAFESGKPANWDEATRRYEPLITGMIQEIYFREGRKRRVALSCAIAFALMGYFFLAIPSLDLFFRVVFLAFSS